MFIKEVSLTNIGPVQALKIEPRFSDTGDPIPLVIVGQNGAGKSLTLSLMLDSIIEARRSAFNELPEVGATDYLRLSSKNYIRHKSSYSHARIKISDNTHELIYDEVLSLVDLPTFQAAASPEILALPTLLQDSHFRTAGFYKNLSAPEPAAEAIRKLSATYFPYFRYEKPYWLSDKANIDFISEGNQYGIARYNPVRTNVIEETKRWILNLVLDREIYEKRLVKMPLNFPRVPFQSPMNLHAPPNVDIFTGYDGPNHRVLTLINEVILAMLKAGDPTFSSARIGIGHKRNRVLSVFGTRQGQTEETIVPDIDQLSSGQLMSLGLATEIIRTHELVHSSVPDQLSAITGISLIDEVDLHLHINFQKTLLPSLLRKFPRVQFIMTTHSPFFLLGMAELGEVDIFNLPIGNRIAAEEFGEFEVGYDVFVKKNEQFRSRYQLLTEQVQIAGRPLLITEGKTDWQHFKRALAKFQAAGEYNDLDIEFLEFQEPDTMGDEKLSQMCESATLLKLKRKLIFVFDRDNHKIITKMSGAPNSHRVALADHVYSFCIPIPTHRTGYEKITSEMFYLDADLRTTDPANGKRLWFSNEVQIITHPTSGEKEFRTLPAPRAGDELKKRIFDEEADKIRNDAGEAVGLSKSAFVTAILDNEAIAGNFDRSAFRAIFDILRTIIGPTVQTNGAAQPI